MFVSVVGGGDSPEAASAGLYEKAERLFTFVASAFFFFFCRCSPQLIKKTDRIIFLSNATLSCFLYGSVQCIRPTSLLHKFTNSLMYGLSVGLINFNRASLSVYHCTAVIAAVQSRAKTALFGQRRNAECYCTPYVESALCKE